MDLHGNEPGLYMRGEGLTTQAGQEGPNMKKINKTEDETRALMERQLVPLSSESK